MCRFRVSPSLVLAVVLSVTGAALAAAPVFPSKGFYNSAGEGGASFSFTGTRIAKGATAPSALKCNSANAVIAKAIRVKDNRFRYAGKLKGQPGKIVFQGRWKTSTTVTGTAAITNGSCSSKTKFSATYAGPAIPFSGSVG